MVNKLRALVSLCFALVCFTPSFLLASQQEKGCGERCMVLLCKFYEKQIPEDKIKKILRPNQLGESSIKDLERCIKKMGLDCYSFSGSPNELIKIKHPVILYFKKTKQDKIGHFLISLLNKRDNKLIGFDPTMSNLPFDLTPKSLDKFWTGRGIVVFPRQTHYGLLFITISSFLLGSVIALVHFYILQYKRKFSNAKI